MVSASKKDAERATHISNLLEQCTKDVEKIKKLKDKEVENVVLTMDAVKLHDSLEKAMSLLAEFLNDYPAYFSENIPISSLKTILPDLAVATVLWDEKNKQLDTINDTLYVLIQNLRKRKAKPNKKTRAKQRFKGRKHC